MSYFILGTLLVVLIVFSIISLSGKKEDGDVTLEERARAYNKPVSEYATDKKEVRYTDEDIKANIANKNFYLNYQPIVRVKDRQIVGLEVLSRFRGSYNETIRPGGFLPHFNEPQMHIDFDIAVFEATCRFVDSCLSQGIETGRVSLNVSRITLSISNMAQHLVDIAEDYDEVIDRIGVELLEYDRATDEGIFLENLDTLRKNGIAVLVDDFGTGITGQEDIYLPVDVIKIDKAMTRRYLNDYRDGFKTILFDEIHRAGKSIITEGVESADQAEMIAEMGVDFAQGYYYYGPMLQENCREFLRDYSQKKTVK